MRRFHPARSLAVISIVAVVASAPGLPAQNPSPPTAKVIARIDTLHGDIRTDNYFWLREKTNPEVIAYLQQENAYTATRMKHTEALQQKLYDEMLGRIKETDLSVPYRDNGYWYYTRTEKGKSYQIRLRKKGSLDAPEEIILDENALAAGKKFSQLGDWAVSPGGSRFAYLHDTTALRLFTLYVKDLRTGKLLADSLSNIVPSIAWANDTILFYQTADSARRSNAVWRHVLGTPKSTDVKVFQDDDVLNNVGVSRSKSGRYIYISDDGFTSSEWRMIPTATPTAAPQVMVRRKPDVEYQIDDIDGAFLMVTNDGARNFKIQRLRTHALGTGKWVNWIAHTDSVLIEFLTPFRNNVVVVERSGGLRRLRVVDLKNKGVHYITFPEAAYAVSPTQNAEFDTRTLRFAYSSMTTPPSTFDYDMATRRRELKKRLEVPGFDATKYEVKRFMVLARDGARVPVSMIVLKGWKPDGTRPLLLYAYGSYGSTTEAGFNSGVLSLVDRGFAYAIAHIRGGQEMGRAWYDEGKMMKKMNTFNDFIDVAQYLVDNKYTSRDRLVAQGGSAGGLLMGAITNMRPDLFRAVVADVAFVDVINTMMDASIPLTAQEWQQWGNPRIKEQYLYMKAYSPYDNVERKAYPWLLATTSLNDSQVGYWEPAKWVAKLRAMKTDTNPLYIKINMAGGHGGSSGRYDVLRERAFRYAFILDAVGLTTN
ncbi:MAG: S9 family peptidase [Gemmatimonadaceae bacterium]